MTLKDTNNKLNKFFADKLREHGPTPKGVDFNSLESQEKRFEQLTKLFDRTQKVSVIDYGCGYGALFDYMEKYGYQFEYQGIDVVPEMVEASQKRLAKKPNTLFTTNESDLKPAEYLIAGSIFNVRLETSNEEWTEFVVNTLRRMNDLCTRGFSFDILTKYSDRDRMRFDLYYADPCFFFDHCKRNFSKNIALLHDYGLYDFTILVRKMM